MRSASLQSPVTGIEEDSYTLTGLELETDYTVSVTATNECGEESPPSQDITVRIDVQGTCIVTVILCIFPVILIGSSIFQYQRETVTNAIEEK